MCTVTAGIVTVDCLPVNIEAAVTLEAVGLCDRALFKSHRQGYHLENRTGIVGIGHRFVSPVAGKRRALGLGLGLFDQLVAFGLGQQRWVLGIIMLDKVFVVYRFDLFLLIVGDLERIIEVIALNAGHSLELACVDVHDDTDSAVVDVVVYQGLLHILFGDALDGRVDCQHN